MQALLSVLAPVIGFFHDNFYMIVAVAGVTIAVFLTFNITILSLKKIKFEILPYYPFDRFSPESGKWSVLYFFIVVLFLGALIYLLIRGNFNFGPV
ncbi:MAG TPA: hypothetical protein VMR19_00215 [Candidatus Saccharimonadales bacterium]|jgi:hypothetical protein|nr:hypothetical protein [Candidatus Saccharimonadales bacterium]